ncbi:Hint domain-containing protein [Paracoccus sp. YLB-12]|uniref:Hint domain-containing protein n=1 Tax=Paracoccus maritimus TaxID=2933292 RepID=A0ABT2K7X8_9RHOB|nr:Hint domain-containing protein [Paracoccus sp. YLB-12]MCT4332652.1 Hint domain-containing protein [Paracoccus sp. YLB-12]
MADVDTFAWYLGQLDLIDPGTPGTETPGARDASVIAGTYGDSSSPLFQDVTALTSFNDEADTVTNADHNAGSSGDGLRFDLGGGEQSYPLDFMARYDVSIEWNDGTTAEKALWVVQTPDGHTFLLANGNDPDFATKAVESATLAVRTDSLGSGPAFTGYNMAQTYHELESIACFTRGVLIETDKGARPIECLQVGDLVQTKDNGLMPIRWIGSSKILPQSLARKPNLRPIRIVAGALGANSPSQDLLLSPQHRVLVRSVIARRMFSTDEVLVAAKQLIAVEGIDWAHDIREVDYFHLLLDSHQVIFSNAAETESMYLGAEAKKSVGEAAVEEIMQIFPELKDENGLALAAFARPVPKGREARGLASRHARNNKALV